MKRVVAIVPMRHGSVRVPGKNMREFNGRPLYHHVVSTLLTCECVTHVVIDSDGSEILSDARTAFAHANVEVLERPRNLGLSHVPMSAVIRNVVAQVDGELYVQTHATNPLLKAQTIDRAVEAFRRAEPLYDSLFGVTALYCRLWDSLGRAINHNAAVLLPTQDLPPVYEENSCLYVFSKASLEQNDNRIGRRPMLFPIERAEALDIDVELDFRIAEFVQRECMS